MPYIKPISGHTTLGAAQRYLERDGRALASRRSSDYPMTASPYTAPTTGPL